MTEPLWQRRDGLEVSAPPAGAVLVVQPLPGIGDMVWHLSHIQAIARHTGSPVWILTKRRSGARQLLVGEDAVEGFFWLERNPGRHDGFSGLVRLVMQLRRAHLSQAWILHDSARYAWAAWCAGIPLRLGYGFDVPQWLLSCGRLLTEGERHLHPLAKASRLLDLLVVPHSPEPRLRVGEAAAATVSNAWGGRPQPWIALGVGSSEPAKQWGAARFAELARTLCGHGAGQIWVFGGIAEMALAHDILAACSGLPVAPAVNLPLDEAAALLAGCRIYVGNDTGVLNMAAALGVPAVGLFGASAPLLHSMLIHAVQPAEPGSGMAGIGVEQVADVAIPLLNVEFEEST